MRSRACRALAVLALLCVAAGAHAGAQAPRPAPAPTVASPPSSASRVVEYTIAVPEPAHRYVLVTASFPATRGAALEIRMSRTSPGRYALHEFAKNVFGEEARGADGAPVALRRSGLHQWTVTDHDGAVRFTYRVYGDTLDGTYLAVDDSHAHMNIPATLVWARGLEDLPVRVRLVQPAGRAWRAATQLYATDDPLVFTAPNLAYLMDSPIEFGDTTLTQFAVPVREDGAETTIRLAVHHQGTASDLDAFARDVERIVSEQRAIFGELPAFEPGSYTFIADYLPWARGDGMEHRNSTVLTSSAALATSRVGLLGTVAHEFFHAWNVERIRPLSLEPFDLTAATFSSELWLAEGFTSYYGPLTMVRANLLPVVAMLGAMGATVQAVQQAPGRRWRSAAAMSQLAAVADGAQAADRTVLQNTFLSYYTFGAAIALGLDLSLRDRTDGRVSLDDFMRRLWKEFGAAAGRVPGVVGRPYTNDDLVATLAEVSGDRGFAEDFFRRYVEGTEIVDYGRLLERAGLRLRLAQPGRAWAGPLDLSGTGRGVSVRGLPLAGTPAWDAGLAQDDLILEAGGQPVTSEADWQRAVDGRRPGDRLPLDLERRGRRLRVVVTLAERPDVEVVPVEREGGRLTPAQEAFRRGWLKH